MAEYPPSMDQRFAERLRGYERRLARLEAASTASKAKSTAIATYASGQVLVGQVDVTTGDSYTDVTFPTSTICIDYALTVTPKWDTTYWVTDHTDTGCRIWWGTPSASDVTVFWGRVLLGSWGQISFTDVANLEFMTAGCAFNFTPVLVPNWDTTWSISESYGTFQFTANFGTAAPADAKVYSVSVVNSATPGAIGSITVAGSDDITEGVTTALCNGGTRFGYTPLVTPSWSTTWYVDYTNYPGQLDINFGTTPDADSDVAITLMGVGPQ